ncbi:glycoside hydrolase family 130 protein [Flavihumibacter solisilvae]|uniref:Glycosidase n=1 Tax=Flavihumibacter solisilvae TaxID=1349421 RepID=A0A0C1LM65_9BACT|nr:glycoside hydrolase family 130 protein [Flavihumibacter solisilvae]KIC96428.1 hypothetical protein OI18_01435 [Flavihumibacter solisilvae]
MNRLFLPLLLVTGWQLQAQQIPFDRFHKPAENPILRADSAYHFYCPVQKKEVKWQRADVFNPASIVRDNKVYMLYRCEDNPAAILGERTSRIGLAVSDDGLHFTKFPEPVLYPEPGPFLKYDYPGGCEDPRLAVTEDGLYVMTYTSWNRDKARLSVAFSKDLKKWEKKGPAFLRAHNGKFANDWSKSGSIVTKGTGNDQAIAKINGKYWMYWGELFVNLAWSENLYDWYPLLNDDGSLLQVIAPRKGMFDSHLTECGPPALLTDEGVTLIYNGRNAEDDKADPLLAKGTYTVGRVVFDRNDLKKVIHRSDTYFLKPDLPHEVTGQYKSGTTFAESINYFKGKWFLYYGTADSFVGVAIAE